MFAFIFILSLNTPLGVQGVSYTEPTLAACKAMRKTELAALPAGGYTLHSVTPCIKIRARLVPK